MHLPFVFQTLLWAANPSLLITYQNVSIVMKTVFECSMKNKKEEIITPGVSLEAGNWQKPPPTLSEFSSHLILPTFTRFSLT